MVRSTSIDGQQRLTAFFSFIEGKFPSGVPFKLSGLTAFRELNGEPFSRLTEAQQDRISDYTIRTVTLLRAERSRP